MWEFTCEKPKAVVVVVHGAGEHHGRYEWLVKQLNKENFHVIIGDLPGQGLTEGQRGHINSFNEYVETITHWYMAAEQYNLPIVLIGHSMGGLSVIQTLLKREINPRAVILSSPCLGLVKPATKLQTVMLPLLNLVTPRLQFPTNLEKGSGTRCKAIRMRDESDPLLVKNVSVHWYSELTRAMKQSHDQTKNFPDIPLLVLQAGNDRIVKKEEVRRWFDNLVISNKTYKEWPGLYHELFNEPEKEEVFLVAKSFIEDLC
ncbi:MAG: alpha/beta hydrolase [Bacillaceae bacterium]|nr:alpha/beta hydrolase [Bacillaceae bacterium]